MTIVTLNRGVSPEAKFIHREYSSSRKHLRQSITQGGGERLLEELGALRDECRHPGWDGYGALPVEAETVQVAARFIESLPAGFPLPTLGAEPDGAVTFEWYRSPSHILSVSVTADGNLHYAMLLEQDRTTGRRSSMKNYRTPSAGTSTRCAANDRSGECAPCRRR